MCSSLLQVVFNIVLVIGIVLTAAAFFSPGWVKVEGTTNVTSLRKGLISMTCNGTTTNAKDMSKDAVTSCASAIWDKLNTSERTTFVCLVLSLVVCIAAFVYSLMICCCLCFCRSCLAFPLPILVGLGCLLNIIAIAVYAADGNQLPADWKTAVESVKGAQKFGESMWVGVAAIFVLAIDTVIGGIMVKLGKVTPV